MIIFVYGGSASGKSSYAEKRALSLNSKRYYLATMKVHSDEDGARVQKHRMMRKDGNFITIEKPCDIEKILDLGIDFRDSVILIECLSNLVANEMFMENGTVLNKDAVSQKISSSIDKIASAAGNIVIVSNNIFEEECESDGTIREYLKALGDVNMYLAKAADETVEVVAGIPVIVSNV